MDNQYYKFTQITARTITSLLTGKFWASSLDNMNDPFEDRFKEELEKKLVENCGVFCFSKAKNKEENILNKPLMWAHYANNHKGIAIGLKNKKLNSSFEVEYLEFNEIESKINKLVKEYLPNRGNVISPYQKIIFGFKPKFWEYENECRQVWIGSANKYIDPKMEINEIVFGFRTSLYEELTVWRILKDSVSYKKVQNSNGRLEIVDYKPIEMIETNNQFCLKMDGLGQKVNGLENEKIN